ncbi:hypothetical protein EV715DRAFT_198522 [Schizophyllum commune]
MLERVFLLQHSLPPIARQLASSTIDVSVRSAFGDTVRSLHDCARTIARAMGTLARFTQAVSEAWMVEESDLDSRITKIGPLFDTFADHLENVLKLTDRCIDDLAKFEDIIDHTLSYPPGVDYVLSNLFIPFIARHNVAELSPRAVMVTTGRSTLVNIRLNVLEIADLARHLQNYALETRVHSSLEALVNIRMQPLDERSALWSAMNAVVFDLDGSVSALKFSARGIERTAQRLNL